MRPRAKNHIPVIFTRVHSRLPSKADEKFIYYSNMPITFQIAQIMFPLIVIVSVGFLVGIRQKPQLDVINNINLNIFIPALVFSSLLEQNFEFKSYFVLGLCGLILVLVTALIALPIAGLIKTQYRTIAPTMMFHNAGNVGLPLMTLAFGAEGLAAALILFIVCNILHFGLGSYMLDDKPRWLRSITSPSIIAAILALSLQFLHLQPAEFVTLPIKMLGNIAVPLMLFSLGIQLSNTNYQYWKLGITIGLLTPIAGVLIALIITMFAPLNNIQTASLILFGALPPAVMNVLFAQNYSQEPTKVSAIVLIGNLFAIFTLPLALLYVLPKYS